MIELEQLEEMFESISTGAKWDMCMPMLWGYFFTDRAKGKLETLIPILEQMGCRFVDLFVPQLDDGEQPYYFLHVEREEVHTASSLCAQNAHFYALADQHAIDSYDGMDVGPILRPEGLVQ